MASAVLGYQCTKSLSPHEASKRLHKWRNSYAHGHCITTKRKGLLKNHLRTQPVGALAREAPQITRVILDHTRCFLSICDYVGEITRNTYVLNDLKEDIEVIRSLYQQIALYKFTSKEYPYEIKKPKDME